ncbi:tRNA (adenosine(37)-N6)-threonylcarbamoyltransferase complex dimerization subunit type 1 TsaB, partial [Microbacterium arthrosphaerae]|uniref:tRNA (adenosine(37)-N6)-threonylcarbamoyltransferase complex dimerization subunit type 1 TsaB n=1 Tax=Microbacterium arthrosphaerae TaxID=792652 RepID=UPI0035E5FC44
MILGIDTSLGSAVAVVEPDGVIRSQVDSADPRGHAEVIGSLIERALAEASVTPAAITQVAAGMGPGPFTGLRVGIAAARTFALGRGIPVVPVASHDAVALELLLHTALTSDWGAPDGDDETFAVVTDARRREFAYLRRRRRAVRRGARQPVRLPPRQADT